MICEKQSTVPKDECEAGLSKIWEMVAEKECPAVSALSEVACDILKDHDKEKVAVEMICEKQSKVPKDECEAGLSKIWEMVAEKECPSTLSALPEVACEILKDQDKEKVAVGMICEKLSSQVPKDECEAGLKMIWEQVAEKECPSAVGALPDVACQILKD